MPRNPHPRPPCQICGAPSEHQPDKVLVLCPDCRAIARDIANQKAQVLIQTIRKLKAEYTEQGPVS